MAPFVRRLDGLLSEQGGMPAASTPEICVRAGLMDWDHRDPFDRLILATAQLMNVSLISADTVFDGHVARIWQGAGTALMTSPCLRPEPLS